MKPLPPARSAARCRADISGSSGRGKGIRSMITSWQVSPGTSRPCHRLSVPNRQVWGSSTNWRASSGSCASPWASVVRCGSRSRTAAAAASAARREENSPSVRPSRGVDQPARSRRSAPRRARRGPAAAGAGRRTGSPAGRSRRATRRRGRAIRWRPPPATVGGLPASTMRSSGRRPTEVATAVKSPPSIRVAEVNTTVLSVRSLSRIGPHTCSGATHSRGGIRSPPSASHSTSPSEPAAIRSVVTNTSCTSPRAWVRPASASAASDSRGYADRQARAASRTSTRASPSASGTASIRPGAQSAIAAASASAASARSSASAPVHEPLRATGRALHVGGPSARRWPPGSPGWSARAPRR